MKKISRLLWIVLCRSMLMGFALVASAEDTTASIDFSDASARKSFSTTQQVWEANGIKVTNDKGDSYSNVADYVNPARFYKTSNVTIEYPNMTKLVLNCPAKSGSDEYAQVWANTTSNVDATVTVAEAGDGFVVTVVFANATNSFTLTALSAQTRVSSLTVYGGSSVDEDELPDLPIQPDAPEKTIVDIKTAVAAESGEFTVKGVVTCVDSSNIYVQDATGGICVRMAEKPTDIALGDTIIGTGSKTVYNGMPQLGSGTYEKSEGLSLSAKETTISALTVDDVCTYVTITGLTVTEIYDNDGQYTSPNVTVSDGTNQIQIYKAAVAKNNDAWAIQVGDVIDVTAAVGIHKETLQLRNTLTSEIVLANGEDIPVIPDQPENPDQPEDSEESDDSIVDVKVALDASSGDFTVKGVVTLVDGKNLYVQDATGAICVRMNENVEGVNVGDTVIAGGSRADYYGAAQLGNGTFQMSEGLTLSAKDATIGSLSKADLYTYVKLSGLTITEIYDKDGTYTVPNITVTDGTNEIQIYKAVINKNDDGTWEYSVGDKIDVLAAVGCYNETLQLRNTTSDEISIFVADSEDNTEDNTGDDNQEDEELPETGDATMVGAALIAACATLGLVVLTKKKEY